MPKRLKVGIQFGGFHNDTLQGTSAKDLIFGRRGDDSIDGLAGPDILFGGFGNDTLRGGLGEDRLFGGQGDDTAVLDGGVADYSVVPGGRYTTVTDGTGERDYLHRIEQIYFAADDYTAYLDGRNSGVLARDDTAETGENAAVTIAGLTGNDFDFDGDALTITGIDTTGTLGSATLLADGSIAYDPGTAFDFLKAGETATTTLDYTVSDGRGAEATATVTITINGANDAPELTVADAVTIDENTTAVTTATVTDAEGDDITFSLLGADAVLFNIDADGVLTFVDAPDFEQPADADGDNVYDVTIQASDGTDTTTQAVAVTVADVLEIPDVEARLNEVHYDNAGADTGEFIEVRVRKGDDVSFLVVTLYNGSNGTAYANAAVDTGDKTSDDAYDYYVLDISDLGTSGIQNGSPDGMALSNGPNLIEFLSYEGTLTAVDGPAAGLTSTDIEVFEPGDTAIGHSLQRKDDGAWADASDETKGAENAFPPASLVVSEVMQNPSAVSDSAGEYFEIYNAGGADVDINGYTISDNDSDSFVIDNGGPLIIPAGGYLVLGNNADQSTNGGVPVDYQYSGMFLSNSADEIVITDTQGREIDRVEWDGGPNWPDPTGASMELINLASDNNVGANWQTATEAFGAGDLGSPGADNSVPPPQVANLVISEVMQNPSAVSDGAGEYFEVYNAGDADVDLNGYTISDNGSDSHVIDNGGPLIVPAGGYIVLGVNGDISTNGGVPVDYAYGSGFFLANGDDELVLTDQNGNEVDRVEWDGGPNWPDPNGASMELIDLAADNNDGANWRTAEVAFGDGDLGSPGAANGTVPIELVISEVMQNPAAVSDSAGEYFEIYNAGATAVDLNGFTVADNDSDSFVIDNGGPLVVQPGEYLVLGNNADQGTNGGVVVDYQYSGMFLSNSADEIVIFDTEGAEVDRVEWDGGPNWPDPTGASMELTDLGADNNDGANWTTASQSFGDGDLGTPGAANGDGGPVDPVLTLISAVQGSGTSSGILGQTVTVSAIVTQIVANGYYMQEEAADYDADATTSEGLFVFTGDTPTITVGGVYEVTGTVAEFRGGTQLTNVIDPIFSGLVVPLPDAVDITLPFTSVADLEPIEGMRVNLTNSGDAPLTIIENFNFGRFGELVVSEGKQFQPTQIYDPASQQDEIQALIAENAANRLTIEDGNNIQNPLSYEMIPNTSTGDNGDGILGAEDTFTADGPTVRLGAELIGDVTGVLTEFDGDYRIVPTGQLNIDPATNEGAREDTPPDVGGDLKVVSFNALNYFTTFGQRGADNQEEFDRQEQKLVNALEALDADIIGLQEIENNGFGPGSSIVTLVEALNERVGAGTYAFVDPTTDGGPIGTDAIATGLIYKVDAVSVVDSDFLIFNDFGGQQRNRPATAATFEDANGERVTIAVNHFKSKGGTGDGLDADQGDGQGNFNAVRTAAAEELALWLDTRFTLDPDKLIIGDLNAYAKEDPLTALEGAGYTNLLDDPNFVLAEDAFSFIFDGQQGALDHALSSFSLTDQITGVGEWHINSQEPGLLGYDTTFTDPGYFSPDDPYRASDHDPLILGLTLNGGLGPIDVA